MRKVIFLIFLLFTTLLYSQNEANIWYFGDHAGLDFNSGSPIVLTDGQLDTYEGCATISDSEGELLFYTDGWKVWNKEHVVMPNGTGLLGHPSSTQSAVIVPKPGSQNLFYIFTVDAGAGPNGATYSVVDLNLDGGLGAVTATKNILLATPVAEKLTVVKKSNEVDYWVLLHEFGSNNFLAYSVTAEGVNMSPVVSSIGTVISDDPYNALGYMKLSANGTRLVSCNWHQDIQLFNFDTSTGIVSNAITISGAAVNYGAEFSPSGNILYITKGIESSLGLYQYDLTAADISSSQTLLYTASSSWLGALQVAVDGKIYVVNYDSNYLGVINNPDILGSGCNFVAEAISLGTGMSWLGLPQFIQSYFDVAINYQNTCLGAATAFSLNGNQSVTSAQWDFGDGNSSNEISPSYTYSSSGTYTVTVTVTSASGTITKTRQITISEIPVAGSVDNKTICDTQGMTYDLSQLNAAVLGTQSASTFGVAYFLSQAAAETHTNALPFDYSLPAGTTTLYSKVYNLNNQSCFDITSFEVTFNIQPVANDIANYIICENLPYDNIEQFDLSTKNSQILGTQSSSEFTVTYHATEEEAENNINPLPILYTNTNPQETIYARIENSLANDCFAVTSFTISVVQQPVLNDITDYIVCDDAANDGFETFDLSSKTVEILGSLPSTAFEVNYYHSQQDAENDINPIVGSVSNVTNNQTIFASVSAIGNNACKAITSFNLIVSAAPTAQQPQSMRICDDVTNDGIEYFNLSDQTQAILGEQNSSNFNVTYYASLSDAEIGVNEIIGIYQNSSSPQTIYARVQNILNTECFTTTSFQISVDVLPQAMPLPDLYMCSDNGESTLFNLNEQNETLLGTQSPTDFTVTYYSSLQDAESGTGILPPSYQNTNNPQVIFARIDDNDSSCFALTSFQLVVYQNPQILMEEFYSLCEGNTIMLQAPAGFDYYSWSNGQTNSFIFVTEPGYYSLTASNDYGTIICGSTKEITVVNSNIATVQQIEVADWTVNENVIHIIAEGEGIYEYSLDNVTFQDSPVFYNLAGGVHTVFIRDKNGCGTISEEVFLLTYPRFFTPNGDGINELWNINLAAHEPDLLVNIMDRYGKLIASFKGSQQGWDGTYNGEKLPATDYWFTVRREDGRHFKGHFSLIR